MKGIKVLTLLITLIISLIFIFSGCGGSLNLPPDIPSNPIPTNGSVDIPIDTELSWNCSDPNNDQLKYDIFLDTSNPPQTLIQSDFQSNTCNPGTLNYSKTYYWKVIAKDTAGATTSGPVWSFTTVATPNTPPNVPDNPSPSDGATGVSLDVILSWQCDDPDGDSLTYDLYFGTSTTPPLIAQNLNNTNFDPDNLKYETTYYWKVIAKDTAGATTSGPVWSFATKPNTPPNVPDNPSPSDGATGVSLDVILSWQCDDPDGDSLTYDLYFGTSTTPPLVAQNLSNTNFDPDNLKYETTYYWKVVAKDSFNVTTSGPVWSFTTRSRLNWKYKTDGEIFSSPAVNSGIIYIGSDDNYLYAITSTGNLLWRYKTNGFVDSSPSIETDGTVYFGSWDYIVYALNSDGSFKWFYNTGLHIDSSPAIDNNGFVYIGSNDRKLYALTSDGSKTWHFETGNFIYSSPAIDASRIIYFGSYDGNLYALNPDGSLKWSYQTGGAVYSSPAIGSDGTIYFGSFDGNLYALNPDGTLKWKYLTGSSVGSSPAIGNDGTIYFGSYDNYIYALNPEGTLKWRYQTDNDVTSSPAIGNDGVLYVGSEDGYLYALDQSGKLEWKFKTDGRIVSSPAIDNNGVIYFGSTDGYIYAVQSDSDNLAGSPWPMFRNNLRHTGSVQ